MLNLKVLLEEEKIQKRIKEMAKEIDKDYEGKDLFIICVLRGAAFFAIDLTKNMETIMEIDFLRTSSYNGTESTGIVNLNFDISESIEGKDVLIVEDIIDTGFTLKKLREHILAKNPNSLKIAVLADKKERRKVEVPVDYVGFDIPNRFIIGYGFDYDNKYRNLRYIGYIE